jgi:hypothetical protein
VRLNGGDNTGSNTGLFSQGSTVLLNDGPYGLALGDVDGDGDLDLVTANSSGNRVSVRLNGGDNSGSNTGLFSQGSEIRVTGGPQNVALGDVDGDGDLDVVTANLLNNTASVRLNGGDDSGSNTGLFSQGSTLPVGTRPFSIALGDVDGDGDLDLVTANTGTVSVRLNQPAPPLVTQNAPPVASSASFVVVPTLGTGVPPSYTYAGPALGVGATLSIYTLTGRRVWEATLGSATSGPLPVAGLASGWYLVHLQAANGRFITRFFQP